MKSCSTCPKSCDRECSLSAQTAASCFFSEVVARYTSVDALGCIITDVPGVSRGFGSLNIRPPRSGDPAGLDQVPASIPVATSHEFALFIQSNLVAFSAASAPAIPHFADPDIPRAVKALQSQRPAKTRQPTSTGSQYTHQPRLLHCSTSSLYLARFLSSASTMFSSQGTAPT